VSEFERDMKSSGMTVVHSDHEIAVIDTVPPPSLPHTLPHSDENDAMIDTLPHSHTDDTQFVERTLHFNDSLDFIQTSVNVCTRTSAIHHTRPLNLETANHIIAMSLALVMHHANQAHSNTRSPVVVNEGVKKCVVLGAGGCIFPIILSSLLPSHTHIHAIELSEAVTNAALQYFGVSPYVKNITDFPTVNTTASQQQICSGVMSSANQFHLHQGCGIEWMAKEVNQAESSNFDMIFVDIFDGDIDKDSSVSDSEPVVTKRITNTLIHDATQGDEHDGKCRSGSECEGEEMSGASFLPAASELFIPSKNIFNKDNILLLTHALNSDGGLLAINTVGNLQAIEGAAQWLDTVLNKECSSETSSERVRYHVGFMKVPIVLDEEVEECSSGGAKKKKKKKEKSGFVRRDNVVLFIVKNPSLPHMSSSEFEKSLKSYLATHPATHSPTHSSTHIPLPFADEKVAPYIAKWISMYTTVNE
jgi:hypothetical protein